MNQIKYNSSHWMAKNQIYKINCAKKNYKKHLEKNKGKKITK
jgi:hypothetical protein